MFLSVSVVTFGVVREEGVSFLSAESFSGGGDSVCIARPRFVMGL